MLTFFTEPKWMELAGFRYLIAGEEIAPTTGRLHWQAYIELHNPMRMNALKKLLMDNTVNIQERRGTREQARAYCMKDGNYQEFGVWIKGQGARTDLDPVVQALKDGKKLSEVMMEYPLIYCRYRNGLKDIAAHVLKEKAAEWRDVKVVVLSGPTGCGKTRMALNYGGNERVCKIKAKRNQWWCKYDQEKTICLDEYDNQWDIDDLLDILDGHECQLNVKGSHTFAMWTTVYITTNKPWTKWHTRADPEHKNALKRRITKWINLFDDKELPEWDKEVQG